MIRRQREFVATARRAATDRREVCWPELAQASSIANLVSLVNLQKFTLWPWLALASMRMLHRRKTPRRCPSGG